MNTLSNTRCYTVGNLEYGCFGFAAEWRDYLKEKLSPIGVEILSPLDNPFKTFKPESSGWNKKLKEMLQDPHNWDIVHEESQKIRNRDLAMVDRADFLIGVLDPNTPTFGLTDEVITAKRQMKPVFLVIPELGYKGCPIWLCSYFKPHWVYKSIDDVIEGLYKIDKSPPEELNSKYWKIFK